jgi:uncharacterized Zn finger protein
VTVDGPFARFGRPRRVEGGIKARSARGAIGESWWSRRFLAVLESFALGSRLTRGRSYARAGQVLTLDVAAGQVVASVQGSRPKPYLVRIGLEPFADRVWTAVEESLAAQALFSARLLAGEMPPEIEEVFADAKAPLFPGALRELRMSCTCPDSAVPCKHIAATFYLLAEAFDADPFQILHWRGRAREELLDRLRELRGGEPGEPIADPARQAGPIGAVAVLVDVASTPLSEVVDRFWLPPVPLPPRPATLDTEPDLLLRQLPAPGPALGGQALVDELRPWYRRFAESQG